MISHPTTDSPQEVNPVSIRPWGFWATVGLALVVIIGAGIMQVVAIVIWSVVIKATGHGAVPGDAASNGLLLSMATWLCVPVVLGLTYWFARLRSGAGAAVYLGFRPVSRKALFRWSIALLLLITCSDALTSWLGRPIVPPFMVKAYQTAGYLPLFWLALIAGAPLSEETLFRGFLFEGIAHSRLGAAGAVFFSALSWAMIHVQYDLYGVATIFVTGLMLGYARLQTGSIYTTMFLHGLMNLMATIEAAVFLKLQG